MEAHVDQAANATVENPGFIDVPIILRAIVLFLLILITIVGESTILSLPLAWHLLREKKIAVLRGKCFTFILYKFFYNSICICTYKFK